MATFELGKERTDLQKAILLPKDWYTLQISEEITQLKNKKWRDAGEGLSPDKIPGAGKSLVIKGRIVSDEPEYNGRSFTKFLPLPNPSDKNQFMNSGQPKEDWKLEAVYNWVEGFGGTIEGKNISLAVGMQAQVYIDQVTDRNDPSELVNEIAAFTDPKPITSGVLL